jgi:hypothetical protein
LKNEFDSALENRYSSFSEAIKAFWNTPVLRRFVTWGIAMILFLASALICVESIFTPIKEHQEYTSEETNQVEDFVKNHSAISIEGGYMMGKYWMEYPDYTKGLMAAGLISFAGACWCIIMIYHKEKGSVE